MKKIISHWSIRDNPTRPIAEAIADAKGAGFDGIELAIAPEGPLSVTTDQKTIEQYRKEADRQKCVVETLASGMSWGASPTHHDESMRRKSVQLHKDALQRAAWLGVETMLYVPGAVNIPWNTEYKPVRYDQAVKWAKEAIKQLADTAEKTGVVLGVENVWNGMFYSPLEFAAVIDEINSPKVQIYFDAGNVLGYHQYPPHWIEILGKRISRVHIKDFKSSVGNLSGFCDLLQGDVPWKETMAALRKIGYDKTIVAEMMPYDDTLLERTSKSLDKILAM